MPIARSLCLIMVLAMLAACSSPGSGRVEPPAEVAARAAEDPRNVGKKPRKALWQEVRLVQAIAFCYGRPLDTPERLMGDAQEICKGGTVEFVGQDTHLAECPAFQPLRVTYMCYPGGEDEE